MSIEELKKKSIIDVAANLGIPLRKIGSTLYEREDHDSFKIFADTNTFKWFSRDIQGDVINLVQLEKDISLTEAMYYLQHGKFKAVEVEEVKKEPFRYFLEPYEQLDIKEARRYLSQERQLSDETIDFFHSQGVLAEAIKKTNAYYEPVVVFKYLDRGGELRGASLQGIRENRDLYARGRLKQILKNSDGTMGLSVSIGNPKRLVFLEAPIDLMSYYELNKDSLSDVRLVAMEGLKESTISRYALELVGSIKGKEDFLETVNLAERKKTLEVLIKNTTFFKKYPNFITLAVDNDEAGGDFVTKLQEKGIPLTVDLPPLLEGYDKSDWNDCLKIQKLNQTFQSRSSRLDDIISEAKKEVNFPESQGMSEIYDYTEKAATLFDKVNFDQGKFAFLLANHENGAVYNRYAIKPDFVEEMMAVTKLYNECHGHKMAMLDRATERGLIADKAEFLKQYTKDFIKSELDSQQAMEL